MENITYIFLDPEEGEPIAARFRDVIASCYKRKVFLAVGDKTDEATPEWWMSQQDCFLRTGKSNDSDAAHQVGFEMWKKYEALRKLQKKAALVGRVSLVDYIASIFNALPGSNK